jgi:hypothetical protein
VTFRRLSHPIRDMNVTTAERYDRIIADIERELAAGRRVYIHCWGGVGRTGTVVGIWHVHQGEEVHEGLWHEDHHRLPRDCFLQGGAVSCTERFDRFQDEHRL